jgi:hypothetical protein
LRTGRRVNTALRSALRVAVFFLALVGCGSTGNDRALGVPDSGAPGESDGGGPQTVDAASLNPDTTDAGGVNPDAAPIGPGCFGVSNSFGVGLVPWDVAVADFNGDRHPDIAVTNQFDNTVSILLGEGGSLFGPQATFAAGSGPAGLAIGDFNGDGHPDLVVADENDNTVSVLLGNGSGGFGAPTGVSLGPSQVIDSPTSVAVADFNGDGHADVVATLFDNAEGSTVSVLFGTGTGSLSTPTTLSVGSGPLAVAVGDFNSDQSPDIAVTNSNDNTVGVLLNQGNGTFAPETTFHGGGYPWGIATGDFNQDGHLDLAVTNFVVMGTVSVFLGTGTGSFGPETSFSVGMSPVGVTVGDFNGDGRPDLAVSNYGNFTLGVLLGDGPGHFSHQTAFGGLNGPEGAAVGNFDSAGRDDVAVANTTQGGPVSEPPSNGTVTVVSTSPTATSCGWFCVDFETDNGNCGSCGNICPSGQNCYSGACAPPP